MIPKTLLNLMLLIALSIPTMAQTTNEALVTDIYQRASQFYEEEKFQECLTLLARAETLAGTSDPKLLYLKIKARNSLYQKDKTHRVELVRDVDNFAGIVTQQNYSSEKVREISVLKQKLDSEFMEEKIVKDQLAIETMKNKEMNRNIYNEQIQLLDLDVKRANSKIGGGRFLTVLGVLTSAVYVVYAVDVLVRLATEENDYSVTYTTTTKYPTDTELIVVGLSWLGPMIFFLAGTTAKRKGREIQREVEQKKTLLKRQYLSLTPQVQFRQGFTQPQYGLAIRMRF